MSPPMAGRSRTSVKDRRDRSLGPVLDEIGVERRRLDFAQAVVADLVEILRRRANEHSDQTVLYNLNVVSAMLSRGVAGLDSVIVSRSGDALASARACTEFTEQ